MSAENNLQQIIKDYEQHLEKNFRIDIAKENLVKTQQLLNSLSSRSSVTGDTANISYQLPIYGRFQDMKKRTQSGLEDEYYTRRRKKSRKNDGSRPWYNKNVWGTVGYFIGQLVNGYTIDGKESVQKHFPQST